MLDSGAPELGLRSFRAWNEERPSSGCAGSRTRVAELPGIKRGAPELEARSSRARVAELPSLGYGALRS
eukprot:5726758-Alexandrium_andersonii.AAC.1